MEGVDYVDRALSQYQQKFHGKKWYWPLTINVLKVTMVFFLSVTLKFHKKIAFLNCAYFDKVLQDDLILIHVLSYVLAKEVRTDNSGHLPIKWDIQSSCMPEKLQNTLWKRRQIVANLDLLPAVPWTWDQCKSLK